MKLPYVNVLLYAGNEASDDHAAARDWLEHACNAAEGVGFAWVALLGFVRVSTRRGILPDPLPVEDALSVIRNWMATPRSSILNPTERHGSILSRLPVATGTAGNLTTDAHLATLAIEHGATVVSFDRDFERFAGLDFELLGVG